MYQMFDGSFTLDFVNAGQNATSFDQDLKGSYMRALGRAAFFAVQILHFCKPVLKAAVLSSVSVTSLLE